MKGLQKRLVSIVKTVVLEAFWSFGDPFVFLVGFLETEKIKSASKNKKMKGLQKRLVSIVKTTVLEAF